MKITFIGAGSIGSLFGGLLKKSGVDVLLIGRKDHVKSIMKNGLSISGLEEFNVRVNASSNPLDAKGSDVIVITTKAYDTKNALAELLPILDEEVNVMSLQNGAGNLEEISRFLKKQKIIGVVVQLVRIPACHAGGRGFESRPDRFNLLKLKKRLDFQGVSLFSGLSGPDM